MKTLSDFKRALTLGSFWEVDFLRGGNKIIRPVSQIGKTFVKFETKRENGEIVHSNLDFPKASHIKIEGNSVTIYQQWNDDKIPHLIYKKI